MSGVSEVERGIGGSGYDLEALSAYADRGRRPAVAAIDDNAECQAVLDGIDRLAALSRRLVDAETAASPPDEGWIRRLLDTISREARAGRDVPFPSVDPETTVAMTEGAIREAVRAAGDAVPGVLIGRVLLRWDADPLDAVIEVTLAATLDRPFLATADLVRAAVGEALARTPMRARTLDVTIDDLHLPMALPVEDEPRTSGDPAAPAALSPSPASEASRTAPRTAGEPPIARPRDTERPMDGGDA